MSDSPVIILTGASRGLGLAVLQILLSKYNARVTTLSRSAPAELEAVVKEYGSDRVLALQGDIGRSEDNVRAVEETVAKWGGIDGLVLNAGFIEPICRIGDINQSDLVPYVQSNLLSIIYLVQPALPHLRKSQGKIVFVSSGASTTGYQAWGLYSMIKAGMNSLCRTLAAEEKGSGIGVWAVRPGLVDTSMQQLIRTEKAAAMDSEETLKFTGAHEKGQLLPPDVPGSVIAGLAIKGPLELSGEFINWGDDRLQAFQKSD